MLPADSLQATGIAFALLLLLIAALTDLRRREIPNWVSAALCLSRLLVAFGSGGWTAFGLSAATAAAILAAGLVAFRFGWFGGGDVKLAAATAIWVGPAGIADFLATTALFGGVLSALFLARALVTPRPAGAPRVARGIEVPYGVAIALGGALQLSAGPGSEPVQRGVACAFSIIC